MSTTTPTIGVRTWRRTSADPSASVSERVTETTRADAMAAAIASADFVTIPREGPDSSGYGSDYAAAFGDGLARAFAYAGVRRTSTSGRSHVFEREAAPTGATVDLDALARNRPTTPKLTRASGDGSAIGRPALAAR